MTNYEQAWGAINKQWQSIDYRGSHLLNMLTVFAWAAMVGFFLFALLSMATRSNAAVIAMLVSVAVWMACGIAVIRIRRSARRLVTLIK